MTLRGFTVAIDRFMDSDVPEEVGKLQRVIATAALGKVVLKTPVDTGRARGAWAVTVNSRTAYSPPEITDAQGTAETRGASSGTAAINAGMGVIAGAKPFTSIVIQNNVEYIEGLEDGTSKQSPAGMLAVSVAELQSVFG